MWESVNYRKVEYTDDLNSQMNPRLPSRNVPFLVTPHSDPSVFSRGLLSGRGVAQRRRKKYKQSQHGGVKGEESPPPTTVRTHFRLGLHVKSHSPGVVGGGEEFIVLAWGSGFVS